jgi:tetratricopeptide (TPR) repeat protein
MGPEQAHELTSLAQRAFAERYDPESTSGRLLADESAQIATAVEQLSAAGDHDALAGLLGSLSPFWQEWGRVDEGVELTSAALERYGALASGRAWARVHLALGELAFRQGSQTLALTETQTAAAAGQAADDAGLEAEAETNLARIAFRDGDADRIHRHARRVEVLANGDTRLLTKATHMLGWAAYTAGDLPAAMGFFEHNADLYRQLSDLEGEAMEWANLGDLALEAGDPAAALGYLTTAFAVPGLADNRYLAPSLVRSAAVLLGSLEHDAEAMELLGAAQAMYRTAGLEPDPGDEAAVQVEEAVRRRLGDRAPRLESIGAELDFTEAFTRAEAALRSVSGAADGR